MKAHIFTLKAHIFTLKAHIFTLKAHIFTLKAHIFTLKAHIFTLKAHIFTLKAHIFTLKVHIFTLKAHILTLKAHILTLKAHTADALSSTQCWFVGVLRHKHKTLTTQTQTVKFSSETIQTSAESLLAALLYCVSFWGSQSPYPFPSDALKIQEVRISPAEYSPAENPPLPLPLPVCPSLTHDHRRPTAARRQLMVHRRPVPLLADVPRRPMIKCQFPFARCFAL